MRSAPKLAPLITAVGFSFILQNVGLLWKGGNQQGVPDLVNAQHTLFTVFGVTVENADVLSIGVTVPLLLVMTAFIGRSRLGKAMRATAQDPEAARLMGINVDTTISLTFLLGGMLAGAAGLIYALYQTTIWFFQGFTGGLIAFTAAVMGGIGNLRGAVARRADHRLHPADVRQPVRVGVDAGDRVRLPDPDHGLQAVGPARRADEGRGMSVAASEAPQPPSPRRSRASRCPAGSRRA